MYWLRLFKMRFHAKVEWTARNPWFLVLEPSRYMQIGYIKIVVALIAVEIVF